MQCSSKKFVVGCHHALRKRLVGNLRYSSADAASPYRIDNPPTDENKLQLSVWKHIYSLPRYLQSKPLASHTVTAFQQCEDMILSCSAETKLILDCGCGTGRSSLVLGEMYPDKIILGIDKSVARLSKNQFYMKSIANEVESINYVQRATDNVFLMRADLVDFWRQLIDKEYSGRVEQIYILHPNPYPKVASLQHRWYAHPSFPLLLQLQAEKIVVRSSWDTYVREFYKAVRMADVAWSLTSTKSLKPTKQKNFARPYVESSSSDIRILDPQASAWTNFEEKYFKVNQRVLELMLQKLHNVE